MLAVVHAGPVVLGHPRTRWTLALLAATCLPLHGLSVSGVHRRLTRWRIARKRSRDRLTSPDPAYREKTAALTGQVHQASASKMGVVGLCRFLRQLRRTYGPDRALTLIWDNWPVHAHDRVVAEAAAQRITLLRLPTYAPWRNPLEKLWDWLKADVLRLHPWSDARATLHTEVETVLARFADGSDALLRYVGLLPEEPTEPQSTKA